MVAYDSRRWPDPSMRLSEPVLDALSGSLRAQRGAGREPSQALQQAIVAAAREARDRNIAPETLLVQLKLLAEEAGYGRELGNEESSALRERIVSTCVAAYFAGAD